MQGKRVVITGVSQGIGYETARALCHAGAHVIGVVRNAARGGEALARIQAERPAGTLELVSADLAEQAQVRRAASEIRGRYERIDVLINNAGAVNNRRTLSAEGIELTFAVNHLAYFLLTHLLLKPLARSGAGRVVNVASEAHRFGHVYLSDLQFERRYFGFRVYATSKLENILFTYELARRLAGRPVTANCLHPGTVASGFGRNNRDYFGLGARLLAPFLLGPARASETSVYLAASPEVQGQSGRYYVRRKPRRSSAESRDEVLARALWEKSAAMTGVGGL
jgi:NAD(P)-dependent dehydrogenase (short-subunit alcohol dehydrogenase family)